MPKVMLKPEQKTIENNRCVLETASNNKQGLHEKQTYKLELDRILRKKRSKEYMDATVRESRPIPESFACIVFKLANLQTENARLGREAGDRMIKDFVNILTSVFAPSDKMFVGNNGAGQYLIFAENLEKEQVNAALFQIGVVFAEKSEESGYRIELLNGFACAGEEKCYYIRELLSIAMKRVSAVHKEEQEET